MTMPHDAPSLDATFKSELTNIVPQLRAFARSLCGQRELADDLVQETLLKAWAARERFQLGTSMRSWTFVILRNTYLTHTRRYRFTGDYDEQMAERSLREPASQQHPLHLADLYRALQSLSPDQRAAVILVGAGGFTYEDASAICDCAVGTMKSRVARARMALTKLLEDGAPIAPAPAAAATAQPLPVTAMAAILAEVDRLSLAS